MFGEPRKVHTEDERRGEHGSPYEEKEGLSERGTFSELIVAVREKLRAALGYFFPEKHAPATQIVAHDQAGSIEGFSTGGGFAAITDIGVPKKGKKANEDAVVIAPRRGFLAVVDGMGGHANGAEASEIIINALTQQAEKGKSVAVAIQESHRRISAHNRKKFDEKVAGAIAEGSSEDDAKKIARNEANGGGTVAAARIIGNIAEIGTVGDAKAIVCSEDGVVFFESRDQMEVQDLIDQEILLPEERYTHPRSNVITQAVGNIDANGNSPPLAPDVRHVKLKKGCFVILVSDGVSDNFSAEQIARMAAGESSETARDIIFAHTMDAQKHQTHTVEDSRFGKMEVKSKKDNIGIAVYKHNEIPEVITEDEVTQVTRVA